MDGDLVVVADVSVGRATEVAKTPVDDGPRSPSRWRGAVAAGALLIACAIVVAKPARADARGRVVTCYRSNRDLSSDPPGPNHVAKAELEVRCTRAVNFSGSPGLDRFILNGPKARGIDSAVGSEHNFVGVGLVITVTTRGEDTFSASSSGTRSNRNRTLTVSGGAILAPVSPADR